MSPSARRALGLEAALLAGLALFHFGTFRTGHYWGDDFAQYVRHAANLAADRPYQETTWVPNPGYAGLGPAAYPPGYPLLLAPLVARTGTDLEPLKRVGAAALLVSVFLTFRLAAPRLPYPIYLAPGLLFGLHPWVWDAKDAVMSDLPFLALVLAALVAADRRPAAGAAGAGAGQLLATAGIGALAGLATWVRAPGWVLCGALLFALRPGRLPALAHTAALAGGCGAVVALGRLAVPNADPLRHYAGYFHTGAGVVFANLVETVTGLGDLWDNGYAEAVTAVLFLAATGLAGWAAVERVGGRGAGAGGGRPRPLATFGLLYLGCLLLWPGLQQGTRFLLPILPGYFLYVVEGGRHAWGRWPRARAGLVALAAAVALSFVGRYTRLDGAALRSGPGTPAAQELFAYVRAELPRDAVLLFRKPRALALFTGRGATMYDDPAAGTDLWAWVRTAGVTHVAVGRGFDLDRAALAPWVARNGERLERMWQNGEFEVWRVR